MGQVRRCHPPRRRAVARPRVARLILRHRRIIELGPGRMRRRAVARRAGRRSYPPEVAGSRRSATSPCGGCASHRSRVHRVPLDSPPGELPDIPCLSLGEAVEALHAFRGYRTDVSGHLSRSLYLFFGHRCNGFICCVNRPWIPLFLVMSAALAPACRSIKPATNSTNYTRITNECCLRHPKAPTAHG